MIIQHAPTCQQLFAFVAKNTSIQLCYDIEMYTIYEKKKT
jgi:hypothetical protein